MIDKLEALLILRNCGVAVGSNFHTLTAYQVECLLREADEHRYRKPKNANGSRGRYYHDYLQRRATTNA